MTASGPGSEEKIAIWRDERFWKVAFQVITLVAVIAVLSLLITNFNRNLAQQGTTFGFSFLRNSAGFGLDESLDVRVIAGERRHHRAAPGARRHNGAAHGIPHIHKGKRA